MVDASGLYVTPGLIDIHVHVYTGTGERNSYAGDNSVPPDGFTFRVGVTTVADAGCAGWRNFEDFKERIIDRSRTRVLALINIVGNGMRGGKFEQDLADMEAKPTAEMALRHKGLIVGVKTAHYAGPEWKPVEQAVEAGTIANIPVMVDFGSNLPERPIGELLTKKLRPGDIYTHVHSGNRLEQDPSGKVSSALWEGRKRGVFFDVGHGGGSFLWRVAAPAVKEGFLPDSISTDLHIGSMNAGMKDMLNVMDKFLALGVSLEDVIVRSTWNPAREIKHEELGHLSVGALADVAVLRRGERQLSGLWTCMARRQKGTQKLTCELTLRDGKVVYDLNGVDTTGLGEPAQRLPRRQATRAGIESMWADAGKAATTATTLKDDRVEMNRRSYCHMKTKSIVSISLFYRWRASAPGRLETIQLQAMQIGRAGAGRLRQAWRVVMLPRPGATQKT